MCMHMSGRYFLSQALLGRLRPCQQAIPHRQRSANRHIWEPHPRLSVPLAGPSQPLELELQGKTAACQAAHR